MTMIDLGALAVFWQLRHLNLFFYDDDDLFTQGGAMTLVPPPTKYVPSRYGTVRPTWHIIGNFGDDPSQSLYWCKYLLFLTNQLAGTNKTNITTTKLRHKKPKQQ